MPRDRGGRIMRRPESSAEESRRQLKQLLDLNDGTKRFKEAFCGRSGAVPRNLFFSKQRQDPDCLGMVDQGLTEELFENIAHAIKEGKVSIKDTRVLRNVYCIGLDTSFIICITRFLSEFLKREHERKQVNIIVADEISKDDVMQLLPSELEGIFRFTVQIRNDIADDTLPEAQQQFPSLDLLGLTVPTVQTDSDQHRLLQLYDPSTSPRVTYQSPPEETVPMPKKLIQFPPQSNSASRY